MARAGSHLAAALGLVAALAAASAGMASAGGAEADDRPARIVSLNLCADELVLRLVDRERVASVTWLARDPRGSTVAAAAAEVPVNRGLAEEVVPLAPDLVLAGAYTTRTTVALLRRLGVRVVELGLPATLDAVRGQIREVARLVDEPARGEALVAEMDARLAAVRPADGATALLLRPNGLVTGAGGLVDALMGEAGLVNLAATMPLGGGGDVPLERVVMADPDVLLIDAEPDGPPALGAALLEHPALAGRGRVARVPTRFLACAGPQVAEAVALLAAAGRGAAAGPAGEGSR